MKRLVLLLTCAALSWAALTLPNQVDLDGNSQFILRWGFINGTGDIEMEWQVNCTGWVGLTLTAPPGNDLIYAGYNDTSGLGFIEDRYLNASGSVTGGTIDASPDVILKGAVYHEPWTIIRLSRSIHTGDDEDVPFVAGPMAVQWAYSFTDIIGEGHPLETRGRANVTFIPL